jgi:hypothetical protein
MIRKITSTLIIACAAIIIGWDIYAYFNSDNSTVSVVITDWSRFHPTIALFAGILMGHWFIPAKGSSDK